MASGIAGNNSFMNGMKWTFGAILALLISIAILGSFFNFFQPISLWMNGNRASSFIENKSSQPESSSTPAYTPVEIRPQPEAIIAKANTVASTPKIDSATAKKPAKKYVPVTSAKKNSEKGEKQIAAEQPEVKAITPESTKKVPRVATYKEANISTDKTTALPGISKNPYSSIRTFTRMELDEFMRQYPSKNTDIRFIRFGTVTAEMEGLKTQIIQMLQQQGYATIDKNWRTISEFSAPQEVHFGGAGANAANFYIPALQ